MINLPKASWSAWVIWPPEIRLFSSCHSTITFVFLKMFLWNKCLLTKFALLVRQVPSLHCFIPFGVSYFLKAQGNGATFPFCIHFSKSFIQEEGESWVKNLCSHLTHGWQQLLFSEVLHAAFIPLEIRADSPAVGAGKLEQCLDRKVTLPKHSSVVSMPSLPAGRRSAAGRAQGPSVSQTMVKDCL